MGVSSRRGLAPPSGPEMFHDALWWGNELPGHNDSHTYVYRYPDLDDSNVINMNNFDDFASRQNFVEEDENLTEQSEEV